MSVREASRRVPVTIARQSAHHALCVRVCRLPSLLSEYKDAMSTRKSRLTMPFARCRRQTPISDRSPSVRQPARYHLVPSLRRSSVNAFPTAPAAAARPYVVSATPPVSTSPRLVSCPQFPSFSLRTPTVESHGCRNRYYRPAKRSRQ